ncbi:hypothetical protein [Owenweeksia hongkongensis]|nr:hypothetical protein [Owenweeksia hongkongensis]
MKSLISCLVLVIITSLLQGCFSPTFEATSSGDLSIKSEICWDQSNGTCIDSIKAKKMVEAYLEHPLAMKNKIGHTREVLKYVRIPVKEIKELLKNGYSEDDEIILMFAASAKTYKNKWWWNQNFSLIMLGAKNEGKKIKIQTDRVYNVFSPCPDKCLDEVLKDEVSHFKE